MLQAMSVRTFFRWQQYDRERAERASLPAIPEPRQQSPDEMIAILDRYKGAIGG